jgi:hypothetical protein
LQRRPGGDAVVVTNCRSAETDPFRHSDRIAAAGNCADLPRIALRQSVGGRIMALPDAGIRGISVNGLAVRGRLTLEDSE